MTERPPLRIGLDQFKPGYELRQVHEQGDVLEFIREAQGNSERIEEFDWLDIDEYTALVELSSQFTELSPKVGVHFGIWNEDIFKGGISLLPSKDENDEDVYLKFWLEQYSVGDGVATAALNGLVTHLEKEGKLYGYNIVADIDTRNTRAIKTLQLAHFIEQWRTEDEIQFTPIWSTSAYDIDQSGVVLSSQEILEFANELMIRNPSANFFESMTGSGNKARIRIDTDSKAVPNDILLKVTVSEFINQKNKKTDIEQGDATKDSEFVKDDRYIYKLMTTFSIDTSAKIDNFDRSMVVAERDSGITISRSLDSYLDEKKLGRTDTATDNQQGNSKSKNAKKAPAYAIDFMHTDDLNELEQHFGISMTREHLDYLIKIFANVKVKKT
jgi:RimJ/RimL family protein N-acetyltransferase